MSPIDFPKIYNPATQTPQELIENFVVRTNLFQDIYEDVKTSKMEFPEQHYIIQGIRGQGKTTLLLRIAYEINGDEKLRQRIIPIIFNEEQYNISRLYKLWETTAEYLAEYNEIIGLYDEMQKLPFDDDYESKCFQLLEAALKKNKKKIILFIDNIDEILNKFSRTEHHRLREIFIESAELRVIGASSVSLEFHYDYGKPFYQFFRMPQLNGLTSQETKTLLLKLGEQYKRERVKEIVERQTGRVESLRRLTGGVIRNIIILFQIFVDDQDGNAFRDLEKILDSVSPLYKHRMDKLSAQQQEIVDFIALSWDAVSAKEVAQKTKLQSKAISSQLKQLEKYHIIEKVTTNTKNYLYRIHERFFNIWYLMRLGRKEDERRVRFLVEFLQIWCDEQELEKRTLKHLESLKRGKMYDKQALYMTEALARTHIKRDLQHQLISETRLYLDQCQSELKNYICKSDQELESEAHKALSSQDLKSAMETIKKIKNKTPEDLNLLGMGYRFAKREPKKAEEYFQLAVEKELPEAMNNLALMYETEFKDFNKAEKYYLMAVDKEDSYAMFNLAWMYQTEFKDLKKAEKYYLMAVDKEDTDAMFNLARMYQMEFKDFKKAEKYYLIAVDKENSDAMYNLAWMYETEFKDSKKAEKYYLMAVDKENSDAMNNLALMYQTEFKDFKKAEKYYLMAVDKEDSDAMYNLALMYQTEFKNFKKAEKYYLMTVDKEDSSAMYNLANLYRIEFKDFKKAEKYYLMAVDKEHSSAMYNLALMYETEFKDFKKAEKYYLMAVDKEHSKAINNLANLYRIEFKDFKKAEKYYLMAVDKESSSAMYNLALMYETEFKDFKKAEKYYLMTVDKEGSEAMNNLSWMYFQQKQNKLKALKYSEAAYHSEKSIFNAHTYSKILLWNNEIKKAFEISKIFLYDNEAYSKFPEDVSRYLMMLMAKKQYQLTLRLFNENPFNLKDRFKPIYYALMHFMQDDYPNEYRKMGDELKQTVEEIVQKIKQMAEDYR